MSPQGDVSKLSSVHEGGVSGDKRKADSVPTQIGTSNAGRKIERL